MTALSIVIPAYNEAARITPTLDEISAFIERRRERIEVVVVDDGSTDATADVARRHACPNLTVVRTPTNRGKGHAVRTGMLAATGDRKLFTDADGSTSIDQLAKLEAALDRVGGTGIAFASIAVSGAEIATPQRGLRPAAGRFGNWLIRSLALAGVRDSQRGFKLMSADVADDVFGRCRIDRWAFDVELLAIARARSYPIIEVPVTWEHKDDSRVTAGSYLGTLLDVMRVRARLASGAYEGAPETSPQPIS